MFMHPVMGIHIGYLDARVKKWNDITVITDKKMRECRIKYDKYIIPLSENDLLNQMKF